MKLCVYEVRPDEEEMLHALEKKHEGLEIVKTGDVLNEETIGLASGCAGISTLGHSHITRALFEKMAQIDIHAYSCRCIGVNHIDLEAAKDLGVRVANARYSPCGVADYTVMLMLMLLRKYKPALWRQQVNDYSLGGLMGRELRGLTVGVIGGQATPVVEIIPKTGFYDYKNKYQAGCTEELCPAPLDASLTERLQALSVRAAQALLIETYCRVDFLLDADGSLYCLEANTLPGMTPTSLIPRMAGAMGMNFAAVCQLIVDESMKKYENER